MTVGRLLDNGKKVKRRHTTMPRMYDHPGEFSADTVVLLKLMHDYTTRQNNFYCFTDLPLSTAYFNRLIFFLVDQVVFLLVNPISM